LENKTADLREALENLPDIIARAEVGRLLGNVISPKTLANLDSLGIGPRGRHKLGNKVFYLKASFINWFENRAITLKY